MGAAAQPTVLTVAGADSSGSAGIQVRVISQIQYRPKYDGNVQADLKTFAAHDCYGVSVVVALTAQNSKGVQAIHSSPPAFIENQVRRIQL